MLTNYIKIAWRNLVRNKVYASINVLGLALSLTCGILIFTLVAYHYGVDRFHTNADRIYRVVMETNHEGISHSSGVYSPLGRVIRDEQTFAEKTARVLSIGEAVIGVTTAGKIDKYHPDVAFAESDLFSILDFPLLQGDARTALTAPNTAILTERMAQKFFGTANPMGKTFRFDNRMDFTVTGVLRDLPANTDRREEIYLSFANAKQFDDYFNEENWGNYSASLQVFTLLKPTTSVATAEAALASVMKKYVTDASNKHNVLKLQPIADMHLNTDYSGRIDKTNLWVLSLIGFLLIVVACVNFINLATAQALKRAKEIGVRKVLGSRPAQLFWQFMAETGLISVLATLLALGVAGLALPLLSQLLQINLSLNLFSDFRLPLFLLLSTVLVTFLSGAYPGLVLAGFRPVLALSGRLAQRHIGGFPLRRVLVVGQLALSQLLIIGTIVITNQMRYARQADMGFTKEGVVMLPLPVQDNAKMSTLKSQFLQLAGVEKVSFCYQAPADLGINATTIRLAGRAEDEKFLIVTKDADEAYIPTFGLTLLAGRNIVHSDTTNEYVLNEVALKSLNLKSPQEAIGTIMYTSKGKRKGPIVGVMKDFHNGSFRQSIPPICIRANLGAYQACAIRLNTSTLRTSLPAMEKIWTATFPEFIYSYQFLDQRIANFYALDELMLTLLGVFALIAIFIGCLGLFGLVSFMVAQKTKEIGVRKVLGASVPSILWLFGQEFVRLTLVAIVIASPIAWYAMNQWLQGFTYKIDIAWWMFALSGLLALGIALLTVSFQSVKAALMNPVKSLRSE
ncbi:FtsX-like permease family protein [Spirosoma sp. KCTC 42546]|uniref:FtsX-like permease family protein n=1 Tax=Spirosoma sp. KCTC 42546 TaxID=2520506 RepID=UPI00115C2A74|nr:FtsX-like permease family protein [Spirosoma sp. KCTC 42546]QDK77921.1 FtsX-like permease family protein [Spirosoma sp. KCTC 42546]